MQDSEMTLSNDITDVLKHAWRQFLSDRECAGLQSAIEKYVPLQTPLDNKGDEGWLWFTRAAVSRIKHGFNNAEWVGLATSAADCGHIIAMEWVASAYLYKSDPVVSKDRIREYVNNVFDSPLGLCANKLANNVLWSSDMQEFVEIFDGLFDSSTLAAARYINENAGSQPGWFIGDFEIKPLSISTTTLVQLKETLIAAWNFNIDARKPVGKGFCAVLPLNYQDDHLVVYVDHGALSLKKENELGSIILCQWHRNDTGPIDLISQITEWIEASPAQLWPLMHLALSPSIEMNTSDSPNLSVEEILFEAEIVN